MYIQDYQQFSTSLRNISFADIQQKFRQLNNNQIGRYLPEYVPRLQPFQQQIDQHKKGEQKMRKVPSFDGKKQYNNTQNLHRRIITVFKDFTNSQYKDLRQFLRLSMDIDQLSIMLSRVQILRFKNSQFNLIYYLFTLGRRGIRLYMKLRQQILKEGSADKIKFLPISTHNSAKYNDKYPYLDAISISENRWGEMVNLAGFQYEQEFTKVLFASRNQLSGIQIIQYCLWLNKQCYSSSSPSK